MKYLMINPYLGAPIQTKIDLTGEASLFAYGDSFTAGQNASSSGNRYINQFATNKGLALTNRASGGRGCWYAASAIQTETFARSTTTVSVMAGLNDIRRNGANIKTLRKIEATHRAIILKCLASSSAASGSSGVTRSGTFSVYNAAGVGGQFNASGSIPGNFASFTQTDGNYWQWTFTGTAFGIQFIANSGDVQTFGTATISIDGVVHEVIDLNIWYDNISDGTYDNRRGPLGRTFHGLSNTSHTIRVTANGGIVPIDFFCPLQTIPNSASMLFAEIPYLNDTGYALSPSSGTVAVSNLASLVIESLVNEYRSLGYNIAFIRTNQYYDVTTGIDTDNIHPNDTGHDQIDLAFRAACL